MDDTFPWNSLADTFDVNDPNLARIDPQAADNVLIAWPVILGLINTLKPYPRILDFGCGTGGFCQKLSAMGADVIGIDPSGKMIEIARKKTDPKIKFIEGSAESIKPSDNYDAITSIMVLQFIEEAKVPLKIFAETIQTNGLLIFAVHNPDYVLNWIQEGERFDDYNLLEKTAYIIFDQGTRIKLFIRTAKDYDALIIPMGFEKIAEETPPFSDEYYQLYGAIENPTVSNNEFLILAYQKTFQPA